MGHVTRREFVKVATATAGSLGFAPAVLAQQPFSRVLGANDDIRIAQVGLGQKIGFGGRPSGKGQKDINHWRKIPGVRVVAICDPEQEFLDREAQKFKDRNEWVDTYTDVRKLLDDPNIDAVAITSPDHWHALMAVWSCQAGKDVFVQKPASHNIFEGRQMVEAAAKYGRIAQSATGPRGQSGFGEAIDYVRTGVLGKITYIHAIDYRWRPHIGLVKSVTPVPKTLDYDLFSGPAPVVPINRKQVHYDWHWNWLYGTGEVGNNGVHKIDAARWALGIDALPERVVSIGGRFGEEDDGETPNTLVGFLDYEPAPIIYELRGMPREKALRKGDFGKEDMDLYRGLRGGVWINCEHGSVCNNQVFDDKGQLVETLEPTNDNVFVNFIKCMRSRRPEDLRTDMLQGHLSASLCHMINTSHRVGNDASVEEAKDVAKSEKEFAETFDRVLTHMDANEIDLKKTPLTLGASLKMNPETERFEGHFSEAANGMARGKYRKPFVVPKVV